MSENYSVELFREEGTEFRSIRLSVEADGSIRMGAHDIGPIVESSWGDDDYEFWIDIPPTSHLKLLLALLRTQYSGRSNAVDELHAFCKKEGIDCDWMSWI